MLIGIGGTKSVNGWIQLEMKKCRSLTHYIMNFHMYLGMTECLGASSMLHHLLPVL